MQELLNQITSILNSETNDLSRSEYRELLQDLRSDIDSRLDGLELDEELDSEDEH